MKLMKKLWILVLTLVFVVAGLIPSGLQVAFAEVKYPGLDVVIVIDFSFSTFPGYNNREADTELMCLDAAAMLINMCDSTYSKVAIVPFTDGQPFIENYNISNGSLWNTWIDASDSNQRKALCDSLFVSEMYKAGQSRIHQGNTNYAVGMQQALDLVRSSNTGNQKLVLVLGDGISQPASVQNETAAINCAREIEGFNGQIYCLQFGNDLNGQRLLHNIATSDETCWSNVQPSELKDRFSDVFAKLIGTEQETVYSQSVTDTNQEVFNISIPHKAVSEVNVVMDINKITGDATVLNGNDEVISEGANLLRYTNRNYNRFEYEAYDFVSLKIIDPMPGIWKVMVGRASDVPPSEPMTIDLLYNYEIELAAGLSGAENNAFRKNEHVTIESYFIDADGNPSDDETLYSGRQADDTGIEAKLTIYNAAGAAVFESPMVSDYENHCFRYDFDLNTTDFVDKNTAEDQYFHYVVNASGDHLMRTADSSDQSFYVYGEKPIRLTEEPVVLGTLCFNDVFGRDLPDYLLSEPLSNYFADGDGDELTYIIDNANVYGLQPEIGEHESELVLGVRRLSDENLQDGYVDVYAQDGAGNRSDSVRFMADVISIGGLVEDCISFRTDAALAVPEGKIGKGQSVTVNTDYDIAPPSAEFPYSELSNLVSRDLVDAALTVTHTAVEKPEDTDFQVSESGMSYTLSSGHSTGRVKVDSSAVVSGIEKAIGSSTFEVVNMPPEIAVDVGDQLKAAGATGDEEPVFTVDKDKPEATKLSFELNQMFSDADGEYDHLSYTATATNVQEDRDIFVLARFLLRTVGLIEKDGDVVGLDASGEEHALEADVLSVKPLRFGKADVEVTATDEDGASASMTLHYSITSSRDIMMCIITYVILGLILILVIAILINKLVVHQPWPRIGMAGSRMKGYRDGVPQPVKGNDEWDVNLNGRKMVSLATLYRFADPSDPNKEKIKAELEKILVWPTTRQVFIVELKGKISANSVTVNGMDLMKKKKAKWPNGTQLIVKLRLAEGTEIDLGWKRVSTSARATRPSATSPTRRKSF